MRKKSERKEEKRMNTETRYVTERTIGGTTYIIESVASESAKETAYDKLRKMIENEAKHMTINDNTEPKEKAS
jgi:hypothetical protein